MKRTLQGLSSLLVLLFIVGSVSFAQDAKTAITNAYNAAQEKATAGSYEEAIKDDFVVFVYKWIGALFKWELNR